MTTQQAQPMVDLTLFTLFRFLWSKKYWVAGIPFVMTFFTALWTLTIPETYQSDTLLAPTEEAQGAGLSEMVGQLGGIASLAGLSVGNDSTDNVTVAIAILNSRQFAKKFIEKYELAVPLVAGTGWNSETGELIIDSDIYDVEQQEWVRAAKPNRPTVPIQQELYERLSELLMINRDSVTGLVTISLEFFSPRLAQHWLSLIVYEINEEMRQREISSAQGNIDYLQSKVEDLDNIEMVKVFYQLIEQETKDLMLAEVTSDFVFTVIDPPVVAVDKFAPQRGLICIIVAAVSGFVVLLGFIFAFLIIPSVGIGSDRST